MGGHGVGVGVGGGGVGVPALQQRSKPESSGGGGIQTVQHPPGDLYDDKSNKSNGSGSRVDSVCLSPLTGSLCSCSSVNLARFFFFFVLFLLLVFNSVYKFKRLSFPSK